MYSATDVIYVGYVNFPRVSLDFGEVTSSLSPLVNKCNLCSVQVLKSQIWSANAEKSIPLQCTLPCPLFQNHLSSFSLSSLYLASSSFFPLATLIPLHLHPLTPPFRHILSLILSFLLVSSFFFFLPPFLTLSKPFLLSTSSDSPPPLHFLVKNYHF
jgi:hypothetical protein